MPLPSLEGAEEAAGAPAATSATSAAVGWQRDGVAVPGEGLSAISKKKNSTFPGKGHLLSLKLS